MNGFQGGADLSFPIAETLRGDDKWSDLGHVTLPFALLRRLDTALGPTKSAVLKEYEAFKDTISNLDLLLWRAAGQTFYNTSRFDFDARLIDPDEIAADLRTYGNGNGFSSQVRTTYEKFAFAEQIERLAEKDLLYSPLGRFKGVDLDPGVVSNLEMHHVFEEIIRRFAEQGNETAGEHFTPREVIHLMVADGGSAFHGGSG